MVILLRSCHAASWSCAIVIFYPVGHDRDSVGCIFQYAGAWAGSRLTWQVARHEEKQEFDMSLMPNKSPEPTAVGAGSSAVAAHAVSRRWLSFFR